jgi:predicted RNA-binding Zn-ribbon protein involved in translation (DUF1610 family)
VKPKRSRSAVVTAFTVEIRCPHCGEPQPSPGSGSHFWTIDEMRSQEGPKTCTACDEPFRLLAQSRVGVS